MRGEGWWSALDHIFAWSLTHIHQCTQQSLKILKGFQQYANDLFLHQFPGCFSLLNMQHIIMFYINPPFKPYHVILRQPMILAAFCIKGLMCKWGGSLAESTINGPQDVVGGGACTKYIFCQEKRDLSFLWLMLQPVTKGEVAVNQTAWCSAPGAMLIHSRLTYTVLRAKLTPSPKDSVSSPVMSTSGQEWVFLCLLMWSGLHLWRASPSHPPPCWLPFCWNKTERWGPGGSGTCPGRWRAQASLKQARLKHK